ncbi:hypothetical protein A5N78_13065 [Prescottella equi]|uniref:hypothetical protein n=1 Tax=Rhodococcus hoagii TaxID=43767 RepID=UPI000A0F5020|nr:hypothetical protein [Prescottella equi]ORL31728.1 hypothetical protein A6I91_14820 [Prescottella equi]ORL89293.1 hypothetical protein A5N78_13065 [Prescottella equi]ORM17396.1 hypothetical protein A5N70_13795 [Prescottella equi]
MSRIIVAVLVVAALLGTGFAFYRALSDVAQTSTERPLADEVATVRGRTVTCVELLPDSCSFDMQFAFDRWGDGLNAYLASDLGPWGRGVSDASAAKLGLQACNLSSIPGQTYLEFERVARADHPDANTSQLYPFWDQARRILCPAG